MSQNATPKVGPLEGRYWYMSAKSQDSTLPFMIIMTGALVAALAAYMAWDRPRWDFQSASRFESKNRAPSSVISLTENHSIISGYEKKMLTINLDCVREGKLQELESDASHIRLTGQVCDFQMDQKLKTTSVLNRTSAIEATTFMQGTSHFSTDYIYLENGNNQIMLTLVDNEGANRLAELKVHKKAELHR